MQCPTCDADLVCLKCRNPVADPIPDAISSNDVLLDENGDTAFDDDDEDDEDAVSVAIGYDEDTGMVIVNFAKETTWLALSPDNAADLANAILDNAADAKKIILAKAD